MKVINLRDIYPHYTQDCFVEVTDEVADLFSEFDHRLPNKQAKRIYAHFILGMTKKDIARAEGVHEKVVRVAIERGLRSLEKILKKVL